MIYNGHRIALKGVGRIKLRWILEKDFMRGVGGLKWLRMMLVIVYSLSC